MFKYLIFNVFQVHLGCVSLLAYLVPDLVFLAQILKYFQSHVMTHCVYLNTKKLRILSFSIRISVNMSFIRNVDRSLMIFYISIAKTRIETEPSTCNNS